MAKPPKKVEEPISEEEEKKETKEVVPKPEAKHAEFKLPQEIHELPKRVEELGAGVKDLTTKLGDLFKTVESFKPEEKVPCPGCEVPIPKSKLPEVEERMAKKYTKEREIERVVPQEVEKIVHKPITWEEFAGAVKETFPEHPGETQLEALEKVSKTMETKGWIKR